MTPPDALNLGFALQAENRTVAGLIPETRPESRLPQAKKPRLSLEPGFSFGVWRSGKRTKKWLWEFNGTNWVDRSVPARSARVPTWPLDPPSACNGRP